ncbi:acetyltransferase (GNAT) family protein [Nocardioides albertanoniae]|uniref:Acetyltransferase (GNAT) family protein n=2 Tax=Nocardioides albertanoniae TaxID=1175486 RepID=A0A543AB11_9ACTN|nr:GNAT family N-acetyltransferase [Nocardioides albertanoniae]TQL69791.1 acetyltransferase (GNAT) family protein [Nocardioides albertanoniae]
MSSNRIVRTAEERDLDTVVSLRAEMFAAMSVLAESSEWQRNARTWFADRLDDPRCRIVVVEVAGRVVSCALGTIRDAAPSPSAPRGSDILVSNVSTAPDARGRGHGRAAFDAVMAWAQASGVERAELLATVDGREMYERAGFKETGHPAMRADLRL